MSEYRWHQRLAEESYNKVEKFRNEIRTLSCEELKSEIKKLSTHVKEIRMWAVGVTDYSFLDTQEDKLLCAEDLYNTKCS